MVKDEKTDEHRDGQMQADTKSLWTKKLGLNGCSNVKTKLDLNKTVTKLFKC